MQEAKAWVYLLGIGYRESQWKFRARFSVLWGELGSIRHEAGRAQKRCGMPVWGIQFWKETEKSTEEFEFTEWKASRFTLNKSTDRDWRWKWKWSFRSYGKHLLGWGGAKELVEKIHSFMLFFFKGNICQHMWDILEGILHVICFHSYHPMKKTPVYFYRWVNGEDLEFDN